MNTSAWMIAMVVAAGLLVGCGAQQKYDLELRHAHGALQADFPELAERHLDKADELAAENEATPDDRATLLRAEARLQDDDPIGARELAQAVAENNVPGTRRRAQAEEILAKADIRQGRFIEARGHLSEADRSYASEADKLRVSDLVHLLDGLEAYARGQTREARQHWRAIDDQDLRVSISANIEDN